MHNTSWVYTHQSVSFSDKICILWIPQILSLQIYKPWKFVYLNSPHKCRKFLHVSLQIIFTTHTCTRNTMLIRSVHTGFTYQENSWKWITGCTYFTQYNVHPSYCIYMLFNISPSTFLGALPPVDLQAVCFVRAMVWAPPYITPSPSAVAWQEEALALESGGSTAMPASNLLLPFWMLYLPQAYFALCLNPNSYFNILFPVALLVTCKDLSLVCKADIKMHTWNANSEEGETLGSLTSLSNLISENCGNEDSWLQVSDRPCLKGVGQPFWRWPWRSPHTCTPM